MFDGWTTYLGKPITQGVVFDFSTSMMAWLGRTLKLIIQHRLAHRSIISLSVSASKSSTIHTPHCTCMYGALMVKGYSIFIEKFNQHKLFHPGCIWQYSYKIELYDFGKFEASISELW